MKYRTMAEEVEPQAEVAELAVEGLEAGVEVEAINTVDTMNSVSTETQESLMSLVGEEKTIEEQVSEIYQGKAQPQPKKFSRIRTFVQKLNEDLLATLYESEERHKGEVKQLRDQLDAQEEKNEVLRCKINTITAQEQEHVVLVKRAGEKIKRLEATEENHKAYVKMAGERISVLEAHESNKTKAATEKIRMMDAREQKVLALAKKAAIKIKELESLKKKQAANAKVAVQNIQTLKQMLLDKHDELQAVRDAALKEYGHLAQELAKVNLERTESVVSLAEAKKKYKDEHESRKADQKKIYSLRKMIEQYDEGVESTWSDLSQALSEEEVLNPLYVYRESSSVCEEEFDQVKEMVLAKIGVEIKSNYRQVGFFNTNDYHFPVLALGPFDVPSGPLRDRWLEKATSSLGVYYYGQHDTSMAYDMIPAESFIPYEDGAANDFHIIPTEILEKTLQGQDLSPIEKVFEDGIKRVNSEARCLPEDRDHPLKEFDEFGDDSHRVAEEEPETIEIKPEELLSKFKDTIGASFGAHGDELHEELGKIQDEELLDVATKKSRKGAEKKAKLALKVDVDCDASCDASCVSGVSAATTPSLDTDSISAGTIVSLEEQMKSFMQELAANKKHATRGKAAAPEVLETCHEETREAEEETRDDVPEERDDVPGDDAKSQAAQTFSIVKQRLKMFSASQNKATKPTVIPGSNTKDVMKMWQMKVAGKVDGTTPKQRNTAPATKAFGFGDSKDSEKPEISVNQLAGGKTNTGQVEQKQTGSTRCVTIPKNILKKIEAGEALTEHERQILQGIQRFNNSTAASNGQMDDVIVEQSSTVSGVNLEGKAISAEEEQLLDQVSAE